MARSNTPHGLCEVQQNKDLHELKAPSFHNAVPTFKKCCFAAKHATPNENLVFLTRLPCHSCQVHHQVDRVETKLNVELYLAREDGASRQS